MAKATMETKPIRSWWRNCALTEDAEIAHIDRMEDRLNPLSPDVEEIRGLITALELCHHKGMRWVDNIIEAIGMGKTTKGLGTRMNTSLHPAEQVWQSSCAALEKWIAGYPADELEGNIGSKPASELLKSLGERTPLREWQVQRVVEKVRGYVHWPQSEEDPLAQYEWLLLDPSDYDFSYVDDCPDAFREHEDFWRLTVQTIIHDEVAGEEARISLALAIDMLMPCHWQFVDNLRLVLDAIGGKLDPDMPYATCGRNIQLAPCHQRMDFICNTLKVFAGMESAQGQGDIKLLVKLGEPTEEKKWLAASLDKTIRMQLYPPPDMQTICSMAGPDWINR